MYEILLKTADKIIEANPKIFISGSLALVMQNFKIRREPKDLDFYLPYNEKFVLPFGLSRASNDDNNIYESEGYHRESFKEGSLIIDVFQPDAEDVFLLNSTSSFYNTKLYNLVSLEEILKMKFLHAYGDNYSKYKHKDDIIYMMSIIS